MKEISGSARICLLILLITAAISCMYWIFYQSNAYGTFRDGYYDIGITAYSMFYNLNFQGQAGGLQSLVFANHIAPDQLLVELSFYLYQSPLTLFVVQAIILSLTSILVFVIVLDLLKNEGLALVLGLIYLLSPGVMGLLVFDYHPEFLIIPFFLMSFYFFMKDNKPLFMISLLLLLCTMETVVFLVFTLGLGLLYYALIYAKESEGRSAKIRMAALTMALSLIFLALYVIIASTLTQQYATGYQNLSPYLRVIPFDALAINGVFGNAINLHGNFSFVSSSLASQVSTVPNIPFAFIGVSIAILSFGVAVFADPILLILLDAPWLIEFLVMGKEVFGNANYEYFSYVIGGSIAATILGIMIIRKKRGLFKMLNVRAMFAKNGMTIVAMSAVIASVYVIAVGGDIIATQHNLLFWSAASNSTDLRCYAQLNSIINQVPDNASVMVQIFVFPHVAYREYIETLGIAGVPQNGYFTPDYIILDKGNCPSIYLNQNSTTYFQQAEIDSYIKQNGYVLAAQNGSVDLYASPGLTGSNNVS